MGKKLNRSHVTDEIYRLVKDDILTHKYKSGEKINIDQLARSLEVSNIPIREALSRLHSEGYLKVVPYKGMFVAEMSLADIDEIYEIRRHLEELALRKAMPHMPRTRLEQLLQEHRQHEHVAGADMKQVISQLDEQFHGTILNYANNANLKQIVGLLMERAYRYQQLDRCVIELDAEIAEHEAVIRALLDSDIEKAVKALDVHLQHSRHRLRAYFI